MNIITTPEMPLSPRPIIIIGAGGIVNDAHLPAYSIAGFPVAGIYDIDVAKAEHTAQRFGIPRVFKNIQELAQQLPTDAVIDLAVPGSAILSVLKQLPDHTAVLMQKPMGDDYAGALDILSLAREKQLTAAVNFQLRYAPYINAARHIIEQGLIGELIDIEVNVNVYMPWHLWPFVYGLPRVEIVYHSIHYIDLVRSFFGNPAGVYAKTLGHPAMAKLSSVRSDIIMDYGNDRRASIHTAHCHRFGLRNQQSYVWLEGTRGAIKITMGVLKDYPSGVPDAFEWIQLNDDGSPHKDGWQQVDIAGSWFPRAFIGSMAQLQRAAEGSIPTPNNSVEDAIFTMACVEAAYRSSERGGEKI
ncbi:MAG TPA: Gfo/Idh/MocA family oxidoreductase [Chitinophagaceae bacterium]|jgi:predicted dehydrogenase